MDLLDQIPENGWKMADGRLLFQALQHTHTHTHNDTNTHTDINTHTTS